MVFFATNLTRLFLCFPFPQNGYVYIRNYFSNKFMWQDSVQNLMEAVVGG